MFNTEFLSIFLIFRYALFLNAIESIKDKGDDLESFSMGYKHFGIRIQDDNSVVAREWAPCAVEIFLTGDFSKDHIITIVLV